MRINCLVSHYAIATSKDNANKFTRKQRNYVMVQISSNVINWVCKSRFYHSPLIDFNIPHSWVSELNISDTLFWSKNAMHVCALSVFCIYGALETNMQLNTATSCHRMCDGVRKQMWYYVMVQISCKSYGGVATKNCRK